MYVGECTEFRIRSSDERDPSHPVFNGYPMLVATCGPEIAGYVVWRSLGPTEAEILDVETKPAYRRRGVARLLLAHLLKTVPADFFLEVRATNLPARNLYKNLGFQPFGERLEYYTDPIESAVVLKFHSC